jgi:hypothetical protein
VPVARIYAPSSVGEPLRQGEILADVVRYRLFIEGLAGFPTEESPALHRVVHPLAIVISQDCDLDWDFKARAEQSISKELPSVLLCEVNLASEIKGLPGIVSPIWKSIRINKHERYQFLEAIPRDCDTQGAGIAEMTVDFKRCFSIPTAELYLQLKSQSKRRCRLVSPYLEHFSHRLFAFHSRIALPAEHHSEP